jgi:hypothetical protein
METPHFAKHRLQQHLDAETAETAEEDIRPSIEKQHQLETIALSFFV